jgi:aspartate racemase
VAHIGIVACSAEGASLCYRTICAEETLALRPYEHPEVSMHTPSFADYVERMDRNDWPAVGELMLASAKKLAAMGADFLICPDNTIHQAMRYVTPRSPLPWLHIADAVAEIAKERGFKRVGLLGTRWLIDSAVYPEKLAARKIAYERPSPAERDDVHRIIMAELVRGLFEQGSVARIQRVIRRMRDEGCDAVVLGCTELPLVIDDSNAELPTLDSTRLLARAALRLARDH